MRQANSERNLICNIWVFVRGGGVVSTKKNPPSIYREQIIDKHVRVRRLLRQYYWWVCRVGIVRHAPAVAMHSAQGLGAVGNTILFLTTVSDTQLDKRSFERTVGKT